MGSRNAKGPALPPREMRMDFTDLKLREWGKHDGGDACGRLRDTKAELKQDCAGGQAGATSTFGAIE
jgi:hypothetical protein